MGMKGMDVFFEDPGVVKEYKCRVCETICEVERNRLGPTGFCEAMAGLKSHHDRFECPHSDKEWHEKARDILSEAERTSSLMLSSLLKKEVKQIVQIGLKT
jgi:hypothetical protein